MALRAKKRSKRNVKLPPLKNGGNLTLVNKLARYQICEYYFSKSFIIHDEKTKEIATVKEIGYIIKIIIKFGELLLLISLRIVNALRSYIKHSKEYFISGWISDGMLFRVFDIIITSQSPRPPHI